MEAAILTLVRQFKEYAGHDGSASTLSRDEFHQLVASQLPNFVKVTTATNLKDLMALPGLSPK